MARGGTLAAAAIVTAGLMLGLGTAEAIMSGEESRLAPSSDADYAAGKAAFERKDWPSVIGNLTLVILRRPWHDNAHAMLGFAWRKLGSYNRSFEHYRAALALNPRHRGALEYLGEAYLELGRAEEANATLLRLAEVCNHVVMAFDNTGWKSGCEELDDLEEAFAEHGVPLPQGP
jgi:tetratricopeptide (TPR) repeat protein